MTYSLPFSTYVNWDLSDRDGLKYNNPPAPVMGRIKKKEFKFYNVHIFTCTKTLFIIMKSLLNLSCLSQPLHFLKGTLLMFKITDSGIRLLQLRFLKGNEMGLLINVLFGVYHLPSAERLVAELKCLWCRLVTVMFTLSLETLKWVCYWWLPCP